MSSPAARNRRLRRVQAAQARQARATVAPPKKPSAALVLKEETVRRLLLMVVDAAGGTVEVPAESKHRVSSLPMSLTVEEQQSGGVLLQLSVKEGVQAAAG